MPQKPLIPKARFYRVFIEFNGCVCDREILTHSTYQAMNEARAWVMEDYEPEPGETPPVPVVLLVVSSDMPTTIHCNDLSKAVI